MEMLEGAFWRMEEVAFFHFDLDLAMAMGATGITIEIPFQLVGDFAQPDSIDIHMSMAFFGFEVDTDVITADVRNQETGEWELGEESDVEVPFEPGGFVPSEEGDLSIDELLGVVFVGEEELDGVETLRFTARVSAEGLGVGFGEGLGPAAFLTVELWIGAEDLLLYQLTYSGELPLEGGDVFGLGSAPGEMEIEMVNERPCGSPGLTSRWSS